MYTEVKIACKTFENLLESLSDNYFYKEKKMKLLTNEQKESYENTKSVQFLKKNLRSLLEIIVIIQANRELLPIAHVI